MCSTVGICESFKLKKFEELKRFKNYMSNNYNKFYVYIAPFPKCLRIPNVIKRQFKDIADNKLYKIDDSYFKDLNHMNPNGAK